MPTVSRIDPTDFTLQFYEPQDQNLISQFDIDTVLTGSSYIEFYIYDNNQSQYHKLNTITSTMIISHPITKH